MQALLKSKHGTFIKLPPDLWLEEWGAKFTNPVCLLVRALYLFNRNTKRGSRRNIQAHYDLGNAFYRLWLDDTMTYSSALFLPEDAQASDPLVAGQQRKYDRILDGLGTSSGRLLEIARLVIWLEDWAAALHPSARFMDSGPTPRDGAGVGLVEAARGTLGHWISCAGGRVSGYQIVAPTTWNFSPRDAGGVPGPVEAALIGAPVGEDERTPVAVQHVVRSFDPCMVCTVH